MSYRYDPQDVVAPGADDVEISPNELVFHRPLKKRMQQLMFITNKNTNPNLMLAFKVKTTKQDGYTVQKPSGDILSGETRQITVTLQDLTGSEKPDKFLLQFVLIPKFDQPAAASIASEERLEPADTVFKQWSEEALKRKVYQKKLFVWFLAEGASLPTAAGSLSHRAVEGTPLRNSVNANSLRADTPSRDQGFQSPAAHRPVTPETTMAKDSSMNKSITDTRPATVTSEDTASQAYAAPRHDSEPRGSVVETLKAAATANSVEELKLQLAEARAQLAQRAEDSGLRMRKSVAGAANQLGVDDVPAAVQATMQRGVAEGVPVHIVAILSLLSFLIGWFFF